jgi:hypothetical protein
MLGESNINFGSVSICWIVLTAVSDDVPTGIEVQTPSALDFAYFDVIEPYPINRNIKLKRTATICTDVLLSNLIFTIV